MDARSTGRQKTETATGVTASPIDLAFDQEVINTLIGQLGRRAMAEVIDSYLRSTPDRVDTLKSSAERGDLAAFGAELHAIKSSSKLLGGHLVAELAQRGEAAARNNDHGAFDLLHAVTTAVGALCQQLAAQACLPQPGPPAP